MVNSDLAIFAVFCLNISLSLWEGAVHGLNISLSLWEREGERVLVRLYPSPLSPSQREGDEETNLPLLTAKCAKVFAKRAKQTAA